MSQLPRRLDRLSLKLDHMALRVEQTFVDALQAVGDVDVVMAAEVIQSDATIDHQEVEIEKECIRLLALYQPAAIDLRRICFIIKVNSDLERAADLAVSMAKQVEHMKQANVSITDVPGFTLLADRTRQVLGRTLQIVESPNHDAAENLIANDKLVDDAFRDFIQTILNNRQFQEAELSGLYSLMNIARSMERLGDICTNIAEDVIFLKTGQIVRHNV